MTSLDSLLGSLLGAPSLPGAKCRRRSHIFDPPEYGEPITTVEQRHEQALKLCATCPALHDCRNYLASLKPSKRPRGAVMAGRIVKDRDRNA